MTDSSRPTRIKVIRKSMKASPDQTESLLWGDCLFCTDAAMTDYDWVLVYDEFPRTPVGTIRNETEPLLCPPDQTILITVEPPSIKIYSRAYTSQFGTVLTTHSIRDLPHPGHTLGRGCLEWLYIKPMQEILDQKEFPKTKMLSTICSAKQHTHTMHKKRYDLTRYLADRLPELDWFGHGIREIENKTVAMDDYKYHLCVENHLEPHHWTEKLSDAFVAMTLPFYAIKSGRAAGAEPEPEHNLDSGRTAAGGRGQAFPASKENGRPIFCRWPRGWRNGKPPCDGKIQKERFPRHPASCPLKHERLRQPSSQGIQDLEPFKRQGNRNRIRHSSATPQPGRQIPSRQPRPV